ncbi:hypothetical protein K456DRAFT_1945610 [Colletotrichum gloeosporioides 23]|nr:hypothetical protein K456DRAFT_1945610 [Colletotrichum gloeosporioides 23]
MSPIPLSHIPAFDRIWRFCSLEPTEMHQPIENEAVLPDTLLGSRSQIPLLGNLAAYGVDACRRKRLWELEIRRLQRLNCSAEESLKPKIDPDDIFLKAKIETGTLDKLESLVSRLCYTLFACIVDDAVEANVFVTTSSPFAVSCYETLRAFISSQTGPRVPGIFMLPRSNPPRGPRRERQAREELAPGQVAEASERAEEASRLATKIAVNSSDDHGSPNAEEAETKKVEADYNPQQEVNHVFHYLVDQITATVAQLAIRGTPPPQHNSKLSDDSPIIERHVREHFTVSSWLAECILAVLYNLGAQKPWWKEDNCVDTCALIFDAGLKPTRTAIYENSHGRISGTSDKIAMSFSSIALETVWRLNDMVNSWTLNSSPEIVTNEQPEVYIELHLDLELNVGGASRLNKPDRPMRLRRIIDYIVLMIPLSLTDPLIGEGYRNNLQEISSLSAFGVPNTRQIQIHGFVGLKLKKPVVSGAMSKLEGSSPDPESETNANSETPKEGAFNASSSLLESFLLSQRRSLLDRSRSPIKETSWRSVISIRNNFQLRKGCKSREEITNISSNWTMQENAIIVPCAR